MTIPSTELAAANAHGRFRRRTTLHTIAASYDPTRGLVVVRLSTGLKLAFPPQQAQGLETAAAEDLATIEIDPPGFWLHFLKLDADLYLPALLEGLLGMRARAAARMG